MKSYTKHRDRLGRLIAMNDKVYIVENLHVYRGTPHAFTVVGATDCFIRLESSDNSTFRQAPDRLVILDAQMQDNRTSFPEYFI